MTKSEERGTGRLWPLVVGGLALRLVLAPITQDPWDLEIWVRVGETLCAGGELYGQGGDGPLPYPYPPLWAWICAASVGLWSVLEPLGGGLGLLRLCMKAPCIAGDMLLGLALAHSAPRERRRTIAALHLFNPLAIYISSVWGMFDALPTLFLIYSLILIARGRDASGGLLFGLACGFKLIYPLFLLPWLVWYRFRLAGWRPALLVALLPAAVITVPLLPYLIADGDAVWQSMLGYHVGRTPQLMNLWTWIVWVVNPAWQEPIIAIANLALPLGLVAVFFRLAPRVHPALAGNGDRALLLGGAAALVATFFLLSKVVNQPYVLWLSALLLALGTRRALWFHVALSALTVAVIAMHIGLDFYDPPFSRPTDVRVGFGFAATAWSGLAFWIADLALLAVLLRRPRAA